MKGMSWQLLNSCDAPNIYNSLHSIERVCKLLYAILLTGIIKKHQYVRHKFLTFEMAVSC